MLDKLDKLRSKYSRDITAKNFKQAERVKLNRKLFDKEIRCSYSYGIFCIASELINQHKDNPYKSVDEVMADIQLVVVDNYKKVKREFNIKTADYSIEKCIEESGL